MFSNRQLAVTGLLAGVVAVVLVVVAVVMTGTFRPSAGPSFQPLTAADYLWPQPSQVLDGNGQAAVSSFVIAQSNVDSSLTESALRLLHRSLAAKTGSSRMNATLAPFPISISVDSAAITNAKGLPNADESYSLTVSETGVFIQAKTNIGATYALQTLSQLITSNGSLLYAKITDKPRFPYRGLLLDTARNFFPVSDLERILDGMFMSKLNVLHWHIYDSHSFPIDWPLYPVMAERGAYRYKNGTRKVYRKKDVLGLVEYAFKRNIRVIPEFDLPGHSAVFGHISEHLVTRWNATPWTQFCYQAPCGQLDPREGGTLQIIDDLISDVGNWFQDPVLHVGHDEVPANAYTDVADAEKTDKANLTKIMREFEVQLAGIMEKNGKMYAAWDEIVEDYGVGDLVPKEAIISIWRSPSIQRVESARNAGFKNIVVGPIDTWYMDCSPSAAHCQSAFEKTNPATKYDIPGFITFPGRWHTWETMYKFDPLQGLSNASVIQGGFGALWSETVKRNNLDRFLFPRLSAIAERLWSYDSALYDAVSTGRRLARFRASLINEARIDVAELGYLGNEEGMVYRPELCDGVENMKADWQRGDSKWVVAGNPVDSSDYCAIAALYETNSLEHVDPERVPYQF
ncbi:hypothetical protein HDU78_009928 [Chytriomyces hyalinus]|nr:hypothetical protein HDU78_009928 [Chytriomyces hyalinus]